MKKIFSFLAAVLFAGSMMATTVTKTVADLATELSFTNSEVCTPFALDEVIAVSTEATDANTGKYYSNGEQIRLYQTGAAKLILTAADGYKISSVTLEYASQNTGILVEAASGEAVAFENVQSATFTVGNSGSATNGQARITSFSVTYAAAEGGETPVEPGDEPVAEWAEITFTEATAAGVFNDTVFTVEGSEFSLKCVDTDGKLKTTANNASFGTVEDRHDYAYRLQTGGKSSSKNNMELNIPADGQLRFAARTATASDETRTVVLVQGTDTIYNKVAVDKDTVKGASNPRIFNFAYVNVKAGKVAVSYPVNGVNFYSFAFKAGAAEEPVVEPEGPKNLGAKTIAEFLELKNTTDTCILTGVVSNIVNTTYGNFDLTDESGKVYVYGLLTPAGESKKFADLNVAEKDTLTVLAIYNEHNGNPQAKNAIFVEVKKSSAPVVEPVNLGAKTIAEFLELKNTKDTCILTGVVSNIINATYGNFDLTDESGTVYVYGLLTPEGESKKFADLNVAEKDTLTVLAIYNEYNGNPQAKNAIFVEVKKAPKAPAQDIEITLSSLTAPGSLIWTDATATSGWWQIMGESDSYAFSLSNAGEIADAAGTYTVADLDADYSYISLYGENDTTDVAFMEGSVTVAVSAEGIVTVNGTLVGSDGNNYIFNLTYKDPVAENTVNVAVPEWQLVDDYVAYLSLFAVAGEDANGTYVQLALNMPDGATEIAGDYTEEDFDLQYFGCYVADANGAYRIFSATIKVTTAENGRALVTADILCYNNTLYKVTTTFGEGIDEVNAAVKATKTLKNGQLIIEKAGVKYNAQGAVIR